MNGLFRSLDLTVCNGIFAAFLACVNFFVDGGDWVFGALLLMIAVNCFISYSEIRDYQKRIIKLREEIEELEKQVKEFKLNE